MCIVKKVIRSSQLNLRFYIRDGWSLKELLEIAPEGKPDCRFPKDPEPYFVYENGGAVNPDKIMERCSSLSRAYDSNEMDKEFIVSHL